MAVSKSMMRRSNDGDGGGGGGDLDTIVTALWSRKY